MPDDAPPEPQDKRARRMARIDNMSPDLRACVHEHGLTIVDAMLQCGVRSAKHINHLVRTVRAESYQSPRDRMPPRNG